MQRSVRNGRLRKILLIYSVQQSHPYTLSPRFYAAWTHRETLDLCIDLPGRFQFADAQLGLVVLSR